jgi:hypothetical protein
MVTDPVKMALSAIYGTQHWPSGFRADVPMVRIIYDTSAYAHMPC